MTDQPDHDDEVGTDEPTPDTTDEDVAALPEVRTDAVHDDPSAKE